VEVRRPNEEGAAMRSLSPAGMREGRGQKPKAPTDNVTLDNYKPVLDAWAKGARAAFESARNR